MNQYITTLANQSTDLEQITQLSCLNAYANVSEAERLDQGFILWEYNVDLLSKMHQLAASVVVKRNDAVVGYAITALKEAASFYDNLSLVIKQVENLDYLGRKISDYNYYIMGQICIDKNHRGTGVFRQLYDGHKKYYQQKFDLLVTEISTSNHRSLKAHQNYGFKTIHTYRDNLDEWNVVVLELNN
jgi:predicted GNAT superfamily acetyltransferase